MRSAQARENTEMQAVIPEALSDLIWFLYMKKTV